VTLSWSQAMVSIAERQAADLSAGTDGADMAVTI
jgi:hypothetical protein